MQSMLGNDPKSFQKVSKLEQENSNLIDSKCTGPVIFATNGFLLMSSAVLESFCNAFAFSDNNLCVPGVSRII